MTRLLIVIFCLVSTACGAKHRDTEIVTPVEFPTDLNLDIVERNAEWFPEATTIVVRLAVQPLSQTMRLFDPTIPDEELRAYIMERDESFRRALGEKMKARIGFDLMEAQNIVYATTKDGERWVIVAEGVASTATGPIVEIDGLRCFALQPDFEPWGISMKKKIVIASDRATLDAVIARRHNKPNLPANAKRLIALSGKAPFSISAWGVDDPKNELPDAFGFSLDRGGYYRAEVSGKKAELDKIEKDFAEAFDKYSGMAGAQLETYGAETSNTDIVVDHLTETFLGATRVDRVDPTTIRIRGVLPEALTGLGKFSFFFVVLSLSSDSFVDYLKNAKADEGKDFTKEVADEIKTRFETTCQIPNEAPWTSATLPDGKTKRAIIFDDPAWNAIGKEGEASHYLRYRVYRKQMDETQSQAEGETVLCAQGEVDLKPGDPHHVVERCVTLRFEGERCSASVDWSATTENEYE